ncbi:hypothetical protein TWF192_008936 [Orbilia oligospora]|uniref:Uncharacterized protein n=1 Tax=Orbilia oligospora TaxID=2813651 RepID=A0A6G1MJ80_ORBOL|nr:hypothetical protein TWF679_003605 [Orbilia oligospora]KAF3222610.1 hypothetical protein TWF191_006691 [Orbilia oligospora]KAF3261002.1 hypothetical protein TWF192_008936 [Orbilia oligospora]
MDLFLASRERPKRPGARSSRASSAHSSASSTASFKTARSRSSRKSSASSGRPGSSNGARSVPDSAPSSSGRTESGGRRGPQTYLRKTTEVFEAFKMLPQSLQKVEMERKMGKWAKTPGGSSGVASKAKSGKRLPDLDDEPPRSLDAYASEEPTVLAFFESSYLPVGSITLPRIDIRNPITIDPLATKIPGQPAKFLMVRELAQLYHKANTEDLARDTWARGGVIGDGMRRKFEREQAEREDPGTRRGLGSADPIPFAPAPEATALMLAATPQPQFKFLDLVQAAAPEHLPTSTAVRPYDWVPMSAGDMSSCKTLPAIFWSTSNKEAVSVVFYMFPTVRNIRYLVSVGIVEDKSVPNIAVNAARPASQSLLKVYWSGYIDFSRPMIIPNSSIYSNPSLAAADEKDFWGLWKCHFKQPTFGGHQYGMTKETSAFENPLRLRRVFESSTSFSGKYTAQMALEKPPLRLNSTFSDCKNDCDSDDETVRGYDSENGTDSDNDSMTIAMDKILEDEASYSDSTEFCPELTPISDSEPEAKPVAKNWLDAIFERPPTITLDTSVKITIPKREAKTTEQPIQCAQTPLEEVTVKEEGIIIEKRRTFEDPKEYEKSESDLDIIKTDELEELSTFDKGILKLLNIVIGPGGWVHRIPSAHTAYMHNYPGVSDTKSLLKCYRNQCIRVAQEEEIREKGFTDLSNGPFLWDEEIHELRMEKELPINDVLRGFRKAYGIPPYIDRQIRRHHSMVVQAKKHGKAKFPVAWVPERVLDIVEKDKPIRINSDGVSVSRSISDSSSEDDDLLHEALYGKQGLSEKFKVTQAQTPPEKKSDPSLLENEKSSIKSPLLDPDNKNVSQDFEDGKAEAGEGNPDLTIKQDNQPSNSMLFTEVNLNDDSKDNEIPGPVAAETEHLKKSSFFTECSANDDSDDDIEIPRSSLLKECNANDDSDDDKIKISKASFFIECNANDESDDEDIKTPRPSLFTQCNAHDGSDDDDIVISKSSLFIECNANDDSDEEDIKISKSSLFTECNANDDSDDDEGTQKVITHEEVGRSKPLFFIECNANDDSGDDTETSKASWFIECNAHDDGSDECTQKSSTQEEIKALESSIFTGCTDECTGKPASLKVDSHQEDSKPLSLTERNANDDSNNNTEATESSILISYNANDDEYNKVAQQLAVPEGDNIPSPSLFTSCGAGSNSTEEAPILVAQEDKINADMEIPKSSPPADCKEYDEESDGDTQDPIMKGDDLTYANKEVKKSSLFIECNAFDDDDEDNQLSSTRKPYSERAQYHHKTYSPLSREPSAAPPNDQLSSLSPDNLRTTNCELSEPESSSVITRAELRAMRRARMDQLGVATGDARSIARSRRPGSLPQQPDGQNNLQPQSEEQKAIKKPGKIRIPDVFLGDQKTAPRAPTQKLDQPVSTQEQSLPTINATDSSGTAPVPKQARQRPVIQRGETNWSAKMREEGLKRRFESNNRRGPKNPF